MFPTLILQNIFHCELSFGYEKTFFLNLAMGTQIPCDEPNLWEIWSENNSRKYWGKNLKKSLNLECNIYLPIWGGKTVNRFPCKCNSLKLARNPISSGTSINSLSRIARILKLIKFPIFGDKSSNSLSLKKMEKMLMFCPNDYYSNQF